MDKIEIITIIVIITYFLVVGCLMLELGSHTEGLFSGINGVLNTLDWLGKYITGGGR